MSILDVSDRPSGDVSVTVSTKFFEKKKKTVRIKIRYLALKNSLFLVSTRNDDISRGCAKKMEFPEGTGVHFVQLILENPEGRGVIGKIPSVGGGMDIFWNYTLRQE